MRKPMNELDRITDLFTWLALPLWGLDWVLATVGLVRHVVRSVRIERKLEDMYQRNINGAARYGARLQFTHEIVRCAIKGLCLGMALILFTQTWAHLRLSTDAPVPTLMGVRDFIAASIMFCLLSVLTWWSNWEDRQIPPPTDQGGVDATEP